MSTGPEQERSTPTGTGAHDAFAIRPPLQRRSREAWTRVLDAGVILLEQGGFAAVTIAAVCERAKVAPRAIYDRADSKEALILAVYEHGMHRVRRHESARFSEDMRWHDLPAPTLIEHAVSDLAGIFRDNAAFLRPVMLGSVAHPEIHRRGTHYSREVGEQFTAVVLHARGQISQPDARAGISAIFNIAFSALAFRTMYGPGFANAAEDDDTFTTDLITVAQRYLLSCDAQ